MYMFDLNHSKKSLQNQSTQRAIGAPVHIKSIYFNDPYEWTIYQFLLYWRGHESPGGYGPSELH